MAASAVQVERDIRAHPREVWHVITDLDGAPDVLSGVVRIERLEGEGYEVGVRWRETRRMLGKEADEEMWVAAVDEPRSTTVRAASGGTQYSTVFTCQPSERGTLLRVEFSGRTDDASLGQRIGWALFGKIGLKATQKVLEQDLADIAKAAESRDLR